MTNSHPPALPMLKACAGAVAFAFLAGCGDNSTVADNGGAATVQKSGSSALTTPVYSADIRRTSHGIPHITAANEGSLGFGVGYAFAQDNFCQLADEIVTVNGQRSEFFGAEATGPNPELTNLQTDFFYKLINDGTHLSSAFTNMSTETRDRLKGYVAGFNHYLSKTTAADLPAECRNAPWVRPLVLEDMVKLLRRYAAEGGAGQFIKEIVAAAPPTAGFTTPTAASAKPAAAGSHPMTPEYWTRLRGKTGSNAVAMGRDGTPNGQGILLSNPHFPWHGALRFYQLHLTIPGKVDVMGAALGGLPVVNIGFNKDLAWGHTVNTSAHFTSFMLQLDPAKPTSYVVDGVSTPMTARTISIKARTSNGALTAVSRTFYSTRFGTLAVIPGVLDWSKQYAYTIRDANLDNHRMVDQWTAMNRAQSLTEFKESIQRIVGLPWVNTIAADRLGNTLYANVTVVPNVSAAKQEQCVPEPFKPLATQGLFVLSGAYSACDWDSDAAAPQKGIFAGASLPLLARTDWVQNSNDSAWMTNPKQPLTGFPDIVSIANTPLNGRTRIGISQIQRRLAGQDGLAGQRMSIEQLQLLTLSNRSYWADLVGEQVSTLCNGPKNATAEDGTPVDLTVPCQRVVGWDRTASLKAGVGLPYFSGMWDRLQNEPKLWAIQFNPADPVNTPRGLNIGNPNVAAAARTALASSVLATHASGWTDGKLLGSVQGTMRGNTWIPIHGGVDSLGIYNAIDTYPVAPGVREVVSGTSYIQAVGYNGSNVIARAMLSYSQSSNPASPYYADQTARFSNKNWVSLPFTLSQIEADPAYSKMTVSK